MIWYSASHIHLSLFKETRPPSHVNILFKFCLHRYTKNRFIKVILVLKNWILIPKLERFHTHHKTLIHCPLVRRQRFYFSGGRTPAVSDHYTNVSYPQLPIHFSYGQLLDSIFEKVVKLRLFINHSARFLIEFKIF